VRLTRILPKRLLGSPGFTTVGKRLFPRSDLALQRATHGRLSLTTAVGLPLLLLETTGRRTGKAHVTPLTYATQRTDFLVVGSNWGQERQPAWALNLQAKPDAVVELHGTRIPVTARTLTGAERAEAWELLLEVWPPYDEYVERVQATSGREIMVFRLERGS
jgi:deazaflavin-dependent oxidoreductase (nitroreductase family)